MSDAAAPATSPKGSSARGGDKAVRCRQTGRACADVPTMFVARAYRRLVSADVHITPARPTARCRAASARALWFQPLS